MNNQTTSEDRDGAEMLIELYGKLRTRGVDLPAQFGCDPAELAIFEPHYPMPLPNKLISFLSKTIPRTYLDIGVFKTNAPKQLLEEQLDAVPLEGNIKHGFFGLGWWTGETDGDGWLFDLVDHRIYALQIYHNDEESREAVIDLAYLQFDLFTDWVAFLEKECYQRGWLK